MWACVIERKGKWGHANNDHRSHTKENDYCKHCVNYFQSWHMGTTNILLQTILRKRTHSSRQPEVAIVTYCHSGWKRPGIKSTPPSLPNHSRLVLSAMVYMARKMVYCGLNSRTNLTLPPTKTCMMTWWHTNRSSIKRVMMMNFESWINIADFSASYMRVRL